jgi:nitroreductase
MNLVIDALLARRSIRSYMQKKIPQEYLEIILKTAQFAPSGRNTQQWQFTVIQTPAILEELNRAVSSVQNRPEGYVCYYNAPVLILVSHEQNNPLAAPDCACALENVFLSAYSLGIGSCWINQIGQTTRDPVVRSILTRIGIPVNHDVYGCAALGYAAEIPEPHPRRQGTVVWA